MPNGRTIALGDIHGCAVALRTMIDLLELGSTDTLVVLGDAMDRGPDSRGVLTQLMTLGGQCRLVTILGNHEQMLLDVVDGIMPRQEWLDFGGAATLDSYGKESSLAAVSEQHLAFIRSWGDCYETASHFFAHGNYREHLPLEMQPWDALRWQSLHWRMPGPHQSGKIAVLGHTANKQGRLVNRGHLVCIDTCCYGGGWLTALEPTTQRVWQTNDQGDRKETTLPSVQ